MRITATTKRRYLLDLLVGSLSMLLLMAGCQTIQPPPAYGDLHEAAQNGEAVSVNDLRAAFFADAQSNARLSRLAELEGQAMQLVEDEPLKLGSIGSAILDLYYGSLTGHYVSMKFYEFVENDAARTRHQRWVEAIRDDLNASADGSLAAPYPVVTPIEPIAYARSLDLLPVGSVYRTTPEKDFILLLRAKPEDGALQSYHFQLNGLYDAVASELRERVTGGQPLAPFALMAYLARSGDPAAQTSIGAYLATNDRVEDAIGWLEAATRSGNVLANNLLARVYYEQADKAEEEDVKADAMEKVLDNYLHAIALGSLDSAYALGALYLGEYYGTDNVSSGLPLLTQAIEAGHPGAALLLGHLHYHGRQVDQDYGKAADFYLRAAQTQHPAASLAYARFLLNRSHSETPDPRLLTWLEALADGTSDQAPHAMVLLGNLYGRGIGTKQNPRQALRWFQRALKAAAGDANIINEVAWVLAVSDQPGLQRAGLALKLMNELMNTGGSAVETPAFLDTWAAAFAANGQFTEAIRVQQQALEAARAADDPALIDELQGHLDAFRAGRSLVEPAP